MVLNTVDPDKNSCAPTTSLSSSLTPEQIRPISRLHASRKTTKSGNSRILTSSIEKRKIEEKQSGIKSQLLKKVRKNLMPSEIKIPQINACKNKKSDRPGEKKVSKTKMSKLIVQKNISSSEESDTNVSYAETNQSVGSFVEDDNSPESNDASKYKLTEKTDLKDGDYVLVNLPQHCKKKVYYVGEITEILGECTLTVSFFRKLQNFSSLFIKPEKEDTSLVSKSEIELKLPTPSNLPSTSRSRPKYLFEVDFSSYYIK